MTSTEVKRAVKSVLPSPVLDYARRARRSLQRRSNARKPAAAVFRDIYRRNDWGGTPGTLYSGSGSDDAVSEEYCSWLRDFIAAQRVRRVVDLGCGDFRVGQRCLVDGVDYLGTDVVPEVIENNNLQYASENVRFQVADLLDDNPLPAGDLLVIRQVLQHLSNAEITKILRKLRPYPYVVITEHYPAPGLVTRANADKAHGPDIRVYDGSAVALDQPPFSLSNVSFVMEAPARPLVRRGETLKTFLLRNTDATSSQQTADGASSSPHSPTERR